MRVLRRRAGLGAAGLALGALWLDGAAARGQAPAPSILIRGGTVRS